MFKKIIVVSVLGVSTLGMMAANATTNSVYITGQAGYAVTHMKNTLSFDPVLPGGKTMPNGGLAGRLAIGYQFNPNLAVELGYLQLSKLKATTPHTPNYCAGLITLKQNAIDLAAKGILPINDKLNVYGKLGVAYLTSKAEYLNEDTSNNNNNWGGDNLGVAKHQWAPEAGIGVNFNITPNAFVDTSWTHIQPVGGKNKPGNIDFVAVGLGYSFG
jgi:OmpA-OmpF porin, OOP family